MHMNSSTATPASQCSVAPAWTPSLRPHSGEPLLSIDRAEFASKFTHEPFRIRHRLTDHPLFQLDRRLKLSQELPASCIEYNAGQIPVSIEHEQTPMNGLSAAETIIQTYAKNSFPILVEALFSSQHPVRKSAIVSLGQFGDPRAINYLQMTASTVSSPFFEETQEAIAAIKKLNPEIMSLLRGSSSADAHPDLLLRPAAGASTSSLNLLRPSDSNAP